MGNTLTSIFSMITGSAAILSAEQTTSVSLQLALDQQTSIIYSVNVLWRAIQTFLWSKATTWPSTWKPWYLSYHTAHSFLICSFPDSLIFRKEIDVCGHSRLFRQRTPHGVSWRLGLFDYLRIGKQSQSSFSNSFQSKTSEHSSRGLQGQLCAHVRRSS